MILRVRCTCGRNLADVTPSPENTDWVWPVNNPRGDLTWAEAQKHGTDVYLMAVPRPNIEQRDFHLRPSTETATGHHVTRDRTYKWRCRCGQDWQRTSEKIAIKWKVITSASTTNRLVVAVLGSDL